jgi:hypothetical protein
MQLSNVQALLQRARDVMGGTEAAGMLVHYHASASLTQNYQSDRMYPPFLDFFQEQESWFNPQTAVERTTVQSSFLLAKPQSSVVLTDAQRAFSLGENGLQVSPRYVMRPRYLNPWLVIADWIDAGGVRAGGIESYRDCPRTVLERQAPEGLQRLFLDPKSGFPVKLELTERHYLWGQRRLEYVYTTWVSAKGIALPGASYLLADGETEALAAKGHSWRLYRRIAFCGLRISSRLLTSPANTPRRCGKLCSATRSAPNALPRNT